MRMKRRGRLPVLVRCQTGIREEDVEGKRKYIDATSIYVYITMDKWYILL